MTAELATIEPEVDGDGRKPFELVSLARRRPGRTVESTEALQNQALPSCWFLVSLFSINICPSFN
jgi:hypothetical protein